MRACWWAINQLRREHASVAGLARQLGTTWRTVWRSTKPLLEAMAADPTRFENVMTLGVDEHIWHHVSTKPIEDGGRGPKELTGMVDLTRDQQGKVKAQPLDLVPGRSGKAYADWLTERGEPFRKGVKVAALDPFQGYKTAIDDKLEDAVAVLDAFHIVKLATATLDECRRRVQQETLGHRGRKGDPLYGIQNLLRAGAEKLTNKQWTRFGTAIAANEAHLAVYVAWSCAQQLRSAHPHRDPVEGIRSRPRSSRRSRPARSPRSPGSGGPSSAGARRSWPTSPPAALSTASMSLWPVIPSAATTGVSPDESGTTAQGTRYVVDRTPAKQPDPPSNEMTVVNETAPAVSI